MAETPHTPISPTPSVDAAQAAQTGFSQGHLDAVARSAQRGGGQLIGETAQAVETSLTPSAVEVVDVAVEPQTLEPPAVESATARALRSFPEDDSVEPGLLLELLTRRSRMQWMAENTLQEIRQLDKEIKARTTGLGAVMSVGRALDLRNVGKSELASLRARREVRVRALNGVHKEYNDLIARLEKSSESRDRAMAYDAQVSYSQMAIDAMEHDEDGPNKHRKELDLERAHLQKKLAARSQLRDRAGHEIPNQFTAGIRAAIETGGIELTQDQAQRIQQEPILVFQDILNSHIAKGPAHVKEFIGNLLASGKYTPEQAEGIHKAMLDYSEAPRGSILKFIFLLGIGVSAAVAWGAHSAEGGQRRPG